MDDASGGGGGAIRHQRPGRRQRADRAGQERWHRERGREMRRIVTQQELTSWRKSRGDWTPWDSRESLLEEGETVEVQGGICATFDLNRIHS